MWNIFKQLDERYNKEDVFVRTFGVPKEKLVEFCDREFPYHWEATVAFHKHLRDTIECPLSKLRYISLWGCPVGLDGISYPTIKAMCDEYGVEYATYMNRRSAGKSHREALTHISNRSHNKRLGCFSQISEAFRLKDGQRYYDATCSICGMRDIFTYQQMKEHADFHNLEDSETEAGETECQYGHTQGKKGAKIKRINITIGAKNHRKLKEVSAMEGVTMSKYVNNLIDIIRRKEDQSSQKGISIKYKLPSGPRISMGFSDSNYLYLQVRSKVNGISVSNLLNQYLERI